LLLLYTNVKGSEVKVITGVLISP